jgi:hypothetical protein
LLSCTSAPQAKSPTDDPQAKIEKLTTDNKILDRALARCKTHLPPDNSWPRLYTIGSFGDAWISSDQHGKVFDLKPHYGDHEEQLFILRRSGRNEKVKVEGEGARLIDSDTINVVFAYVPPKDAEERKKLQKIIISIDDYRFVILFKPTRF